MHWFIIRAFKEFSEQNEGRLPVTGTLPDMTSDTESYVTLQTMSVSSETKRHGIDLIPYGFSYREKAKLDYHQMATLLQALRVQCLSVRPDEPLPAALTALLQRCCKHPTHIAVLTYPPLQPCLSVAMTRDAAHTDPVPSNDQLDEAMRRAAQARSQRLRGWMRDLDDTVFLLIVLWAVDLFYEKHQRYPGTPRRVDLTRVP